MLCFPYLVKKFRFHWLLLILLAALVFFLQTIVNGGDNAKDITPQPMPITLPNRDLLAPAIVVKVIDGDTVDVETRGETVRVRYFGSDAPEVGETCADEATSRNRELVEGKSVLLVEDERERDPGGRLLRYVFTTNGRLVDEVLISEGLSKAWRRDGAYRDQLVIREELADSADVGCLWR
jgi:endonuclease YncB( thermonuclease family)